MVSLVLKIVALVMGCLFAYGCMIELSGWFFVRVLKWDVDDSKIYATGWPLAWLFLPIYAAVVLAPRLVARALNWLLGLWRFRSAVKLVTPKERVYR